MKTWLLHKLLHVAILMSAVAVLTWLLVEALPGDACSLVLDPDGAPATIAAMRAAMGCDDPAPVRFWIAMQSLLTLDLGLSIAKHVPVWSLLVEALPATMALGLSGLVIGHGFGLPLGVAQAVRHGRPLDLAVSVATLSLASLPIFALGLALLHLTSAAIPDWPVTGSPTPWIAATLIERAQHLLLPALTLGLASAAADARFIRGAMLGALGQDYVRTARAKGVSERRVVLVHALRNALLPTIALVGLQLPAVLSGAVVCESLFAWPGLGRVLVEAVQSGDAPVVLGVFYFFAALVAIGGALTELAAAWADPRIRLTQ